MSLLEIIGLALALAADAFAVSISNGVTIKENRVFHAIRISFFFGLFQGVMPVLGWLGGRSLRGVIGGLAPWIGFGLLVFIGSRMIHEARQMGKHECKDCSHLPTLFLLSIATSIDALAVGISFAVMTVHIILPAVIIGIITFGTSFAGINLGYRIGHISEERFELIGGVILIGIGLKIIAEHLFF
ncbi:MAG: manganese efflux pump [Spirochaetales bacterium]|nr:manganese efflux pump [Spirochaetales bacterium]